MRGSGSAWGPLTVLSAIALLMFVGAVLNLVWDFSVVALVGVALGAVFSFWVIGGCARRGDPLARWLLRGRI